MQHSPNLVALFLVYQAGLRTRVIEFFVGLRAAKYPVEFLGVIK